MAGHSKWSKIKRQKGANDAQRGKEFTKVGRLITIAAQSGGGDPALNPVLALAIDKARAINMPNENIDRAINRGIRQGKDNGTKMEEISYEGYAPLQVPMIIDCTTDNRNRTISDLRTVVEKYGGTLAESGAVSWQFETLGQILIEFADDEQEQDKSTKWNVDPNAKRHLTKEESEDFQLEIMELEGIKDIIPDDGGLEILTEFKSFTSIKQFIDEKQLETARAEIAKVSNTKIEIKSSEDENRVVEFIDRVEELDDVIKVWLAL